VLSSLGRLRLCPAPLMSLTRSSEGAELLGATPKTLKITTPAGDRTLQGSCANHFVPPDLNHKIQDLSSS